MQNNSTGGNTAPYVYRPGCGHDPQLMEMQARTYGWTYKEEAGNRIPHPPCVGWSYVYGLLMWAVLLACLGNKLSAAVNYTATETANVYLVTWDARVGGLDWNGVYVSNPEDAPPYTYLAGPASSWPAGSTLVTVTDVLPNRWVWWNINDGVQHIVLPPYVAESPKSVHIVYKNTSNQIVNFRVVDAANPSTIIESGPLNPGVTYDRVIELPTGVNGVVFLILVDNVNNDGPVWVEDPGHVSEFVASGTITGVTGTPTQTNVPPPPNMPTAPVNPNDNPFPLPGSGEVVRPGRPAPWTNPSGLTPAVEGSRSDMTIQAYREGIDKLEKSIEGSPTKVPDALAAPTSRISDTAIASANTKMLSKLPTAPSLTSLTPAGVISIDFSIPKPDGGSFEVHKTVNFTEAPYAAPIAIFRALLTALVTLAYFMLTFYTIRGAFAGK